MKNTQHQASFYLQRTIGFLLLVTVASVFLFSGISKLYAFEQLVWNIMDAGVTNMTLAAIIARLFIGFELLLGVFLICHLFLKSFTYPAVLILLIFFTVYLVLLISRQGDAGNCGCFGNAYEMKPSAGILKNIILMGITAILWLIYPVKPYKHSEWLSAIAGMIAIVMPFIFYPLSRDTKPTVIHQPIDLSPLYESANTPPGVELRKGKHIVAFMSLTCPHCRKAGFLLHVIHRQHPEIPLFFVLNGNKAFEADFFNETKARDVPHVLFKGADDFLKMAGPGVPAIYWINNSVIERKSNYFQLDPVYMKEWLR